MSSYKESNYKNSIFNSIINSDDNTIKPFIDSTKKTQEYINIMDKYTFIELKELFKKNNNLIKNITTCYFQDPTCEPFRVGLIKWLFYNAIEKLQINNKTIKYRDSFYDAAGSTNPTSDYDLTILSQYAPQISITMFNIFLKIMNNEKTLPEVLDVNIYTKGIYLYHNTNPHFSNKELIKFNNVKILTSIDVFMNSDTYIYDNISPPKLFCLQPVEYNNKQIHLVYSLIKLAELPKLNKLIKKNHVELFNNSYYKNANEKLILLQNEYDKYNTNISKNNKNNENIIKKYKLCNKYSVQVFNTIYNNSIISEKFNENLCKVGYYSIESYYSNCAVNVVVIEMQMGINNIKLEPINYICTIIENLGDLNQHFNESKKNNDLYLEILDKSKYIYRIIYALCKLENIYKQSKLNHHLKLACLSGINNNQLNKFIKKCRGKGDINGCQNDNIIKSLINMKFLEAEITATTFIDKFNNKVLSIIYKLITEFSLSKQQSKKYKHKKNKKTLKK